MSDQRVTFAGGFRPLIVYVTAVALVATQGAHATAPPGNAHAATVQHSDVGSDASDDAQPRAAAAGNVGAASNSTAVSVDESASPANGSQGWDNPNNCVIEGGGCNGGDAPPAASSGNVTLQYSAGDSLTGNATQPALSVVANGANGGRGGNSGTSSVGIYQNGGNGAAGTSGGQIRVTLDAGSTASSGGTSATLFVLSNGGSGGAGGDHLATNGTSGIPGGGGAGGGVSLSVSGSIVNNSPYTGDNLAPAAVLMEGTGGDGAGGGSARTLTDPARGTVGGAGGDGAGLSFSSAGTPATLTSNGPGIVLVSIGGDGGDGADALTTGASGAYGGNGGAGGDGQTLQIFPQTMSIVARGVDKPGTGELAVVDPSQPGQMAALSFVSGGIIGQSLGGYGGAGGAADGGTGAAQGGAGGQAGSGGSISISTVGSVTMTGYGAAGIIAQSVGGNGGQGAGAGAIFKPHGGNGGQGGDGGPVTVYTLDNPDTTDGHSLITTAGDDSIGVLAQSIGGGGGNGGSVVIGNGGAIPIAIALGGRGEQGGNGSVVSLNIGDNFGDAGAVIGTQGLRSVGALAQSIGGGGGNGGSANAFTGGLFSLAIGGQGGSGGTAGSPGTTEVSIQNHGIVQTDGSHSSGLIAQAIGGGGGNGGGASALTGGGVLTAAVAVGGSGGSGGLAGDVSVTNSGQVNTLQSDSIGILAQSIGGGGGNGGTSWAETVNLLNPPDIPTVNLTTSIGGSGGTGGNAGAVTIENTDVVMTQAAGSIGVFAQSVGGGGGNGGDSAATQIAVQNSTLSVSVAIGGTGGSGGSGGTVNLTNDEGLVMTFGANADGLKGQSIGGGGGTGGYGQVDTGTFLSENKSLTFTLAIGGDGGSGNVGGPVTINNTGGSISTWGDGSRGVFAQSVGGGGGQGSGSDAAGSGGTIGVNVSLGGNGGNGNNGGAVTVNNTGAILTTGAKADGIFAQSIGGSGGVAGNAATGSGTDAEVRLTTYILNGMGVSPEVTSWGSNIYSIAKDEFIGDRAIASMRSAITNYDDATQHAPDAPDADESRTISIDVGAGRGGHGGSGGNGGTLTINNTGQIEVSGPNSAGIYAQSNGGGGGVGGTVQAANNPQALSNLANNVPVSVAIAIGGGGGSSGRGGDITVTQDGTILTHDVISPGVLAQSVGGGGGDGGATPATWQQIRALQFQLGGNGGATGDGGHVVINNTNPTDTIATEGASSAGIVAQSIGGGGGIGSLMIAIDSTGKSNMQSGLPGEPTGFSLSIPIKIGGTGISQSCGSTGLRAAGCGNGGQIDISVADVTTGGKNAYGVLAQSIGGGGGEFIGVPATGTSFFNGPMVGNGGTVNVTVGSTSSTAPMTIQTSGDGAIGIVAQSIGGGGLLGGDMTAANPANTTAFAANTGSNGNGGSVNVVVEPNASVVTTGANAHGIFAQSVAGGGGLIATGNAGLVVGSAGGSGQGGNATVTVNGSVKATGQNASAVFLNSDFAPTNTPGLALAYLNNHGTITGNPSAPAVLLTGASLEVDNYGTIANPGGVAIESRGNGPGMSNYSSGKIIGDLNSPDSVILSSGYWATGASSTVGQFYNNTGGVVDVLAATPGIYGTSTINGQFLISGGTVRTNVDFYGKQAGVLVATGEMEVDDAHFLLVPTLLAPNAVTVASGNPLTNHTPVAVQDTGNLLFTYTTSLANSKVTFTPVAHLASVAQSNNFSASEQALANSLQSGFVTTMTSNMAQTYATYSTLQSATAYKQALDKTGNETSQAVGTARLSESQGFVERMNSCPLFDGDGTELREHECAWARVDRRRASRGNDGSSLGYHESSYTVQFGGQRPVGDGDWFLGGSIGYSDSTIDSEMAHVVDGHDWSAGLVLKHQMDEWLLSVALNAGSGSYESRRNTGVTDVRTASGTFDAFHAGLNARISRLFAFHTWYLKPYLDLHGTYVHTSGYIESGAGEFDLAVDASHDTLYSVSPVLQAGYRFDLSRKRVLRAYVDLGGTFYSRNEWGANARLVEAAPGTIPFRSVSSLPQQRARSAWA